MPAGLAITTEAHGRRKTVEVAVVGGGPAGLTAAIALAAAGVETALIAKPPPADNRTTALLSGSVAALEALGGVAAVPRRSGAADRDPSDRRHAPADPRARGDCSRPPRSASTRSATISRTGTWSRRSTGAPPILPRLRRIAAAVTAVEPDDSGVTLRLDGGGSVAARARGRR